MRSIYVPTRSRFEDELSIVIGATHSSLCISLRQRHYVHVPAVVRSEPAAMVCIQLADRQHAACASHSTTAALCTQAPKRGLSVEEKRQKIQQIFHETQDVFQLKARPPLPSPPVPSRSVVTETARYTHTNRVAGQSNLQYCQGHGSRPCPGCARMPSV